MIVFILEKKIAAHIEIMTWWKCTLQVENREAFYGILSALSVHQLAAQGEMLYLATRIEQGNSLFFQMYLNAVETFIRFLLFYFSTRKYKDQKKKKLNNLTGQITQ